MDAGPSQHITALTSACNSTTLPAAWLNPGRCPPELQARARNAATLEAQQAHHRETPHTMGHPYRGAMGTNTHTAICCAICTHQCHMGTRSVRLTSYQEVDPPVGVSHGRPLVRAGRLSCVGSTHLRSSLVIVGALSGGLAGGCRRRTAAGHGAGGRCGARGARGD